MSKASEWALAIQTAAARQPEDFVDPRKGTGIPGPYIRLHVTQQGQCCLLVNEDTFVNEDTKLIASAEVILQAARWIIDTFGEPTP